MLEAKGDDYPECIEDDHVEELDSDFERDLGIVSGCDGDYLGEKLVKEETSPQQRNLGGKQKCKLLLTWQSSCVIANNTRKTAKAICPRL